MIEWTAEEIVGAIRADIDSHQQLKARLASASGQEEKRIELQMRSRSAGILQVLKEDLRKLDRMDLWREFESWEQSLSEVKA
jgi:hypothetical protein